MDIPAHIVLVKIQQLEVSWLKQLCYPAWYNSIYRRILRVMIVTDPSECQSVNTHYHQNTFFTTISVIWILNCYHDLENPFLSYY